MPWQRLVSTTHLYNMLACADSNRRQRANNSQIFFCCKYARTSTVCPFGFRLKTSMSHILDTDPDGPKSSTATIMSPVSHRTKSMKAPIMTMAGRRRRSAISQKRPPMKRIVREATVM